VVFFAFHRGTVPNPIRGYAESLEIVTEGNEGNQDSCRNHLAFFTEGDEETGNPCETIGFLQKETKARKEQAKFKLRFLHCLL
jgi:hypothetical protein